MSERRIVALAKGKNMFRKPEQQRKWRIALLITMIVAFLGPWVFDRINVPAKYECSAPNIRLYGDFCGVPIPGFLVMIWTGINFTSIVIGTLTGGFAFPDRIRELLISPLLLLPLLPVFSTLLLILRGNTLRRQVFAMVSWVLAIAACLFISFQINPRQLLASWGLWLYILLGLCALIFEIIMIRQEKRKL
jgi:hypothetical protein